MKSPRRGLALVAAAAIALSGCTSTADGGADETTDEAVAGEIQVPDDFPDIAMPDGEVVSTVNSQSQGGGTQHTAMMWMPGDPGVVINDLKGEYSDNGDVSILSETNSVEGDTPMAGFAWSSEEWPTYNSFSATKNDQADGRDGSILTIVVVDDGANEDDS